MADTPISGMGLSFMPGGSDQNGQSQNQRSGIAGAIQTLALRIPRVVGASAGAPQGLLQGAGGAGLGGANPNSAAVLEQIRRYLFGANPAGVNTGMPMPRSTVDNSGSGGVYEVPRTPGATLPDPSFGFGNPKQPLPTAPQPPAAPAPAPQQPSMSGPMPSGPRDRRI